MLSGGGGGDLSVLCEERRILEVVSNVLRLYVGVESERAQLCSVRCSKSSARLAVPLRVCQRGGTLAVRARVSAGSLRGAGLVVRRAAASDGAGEGAGAA